MIVQIIQQIIRNILYLLFIRRRCDRTSNMHELFVPEPPGSLNLIEGWRQGTAHPFSKKHSRAHAWP